jgi:hypothetical protein
MAGRTSALEHALRPDLQHVAEPDRRVERLNLPITGSAIRRGLSTGVKQRAQRMDHFTTAHNTNSQPFVWPALPTSTDAPEPPNSANERPHWSNYEFDRSWPVAGPH